MSEGEDGADGHLDDVSIDERPFVELLVSMGITSYEPLVPTALADYAKRELLNCLEIDLTDIVTCSRLGCGATL